jgi:hypothetical protein
MHLLMFSLVSINALRAYPQIISEAQEKSGCLLAEARANYLKHTQIFPVTFQNFGICS